MEWTWQEFRITDQRQDLDDAMIHRFLSQESYWARDIPLAVVQQSLEHSLCFGVFQGAQQIGLGRVITDCATFAYLADVFILPPYRGKGIGQWLITCILSHPDLQGLRRWLLATADAHRFYERLGFTLSESGRLMEKVDRTVYQRL